MFDDGSRPENTAVSYTYCMSEILPNSESNDSIKADRLTDIKEHEGKMFSSERINISSDMLKKFLEATGDSNPIHFDALRSKESVLAGPDENKVVVSGFLTLSLCAHEKVLYEALIISEPHEVISLGMKDIKYLEPIFADSDVMYEYTLKSVQNMKIKSRDAARVEWEITASKIENEQRAPCMKVSWTVAYVSLEM